MRVENIFEFSGLLSRRAVVGQRGEQWGGSPGADVPCKDEIHCCHCTTLPLYLVVKMKSTLAEPLIVRLSASSWTISLSAGSTVFHQGDINYVDFFHSWVRHLIFTDPSTICHLTSVKYAWKTLKPKIYVWILRGGEIYCIRVYCGGEISKADILFGEFCHCLEFFASLICQCALEYLWLCVCVLKWRRKTKLSSSNHHIAWVNCLLDWNALFVWQSVNQTNWTDCQ